MRKNFSVIFDSGEANLRRYRLSGADAADTKIKNGQKAVMEYLLLGRVNA